MEALPKKCTLEMLDEDLMTAAMCVYREAQHYRHQQMIASAQGNETFERFLEAEFMRLTSISNQLALATKDCKDVDN